MTTLQKPIGILGGTFDPIHLGHLRIALELQHALDLARVHLIPAYLPAHRDTPCATPAQRLEMVTLAVASEPTLYPDPREINRQAASYTIDTLEEMRHEFPQTPLCLLLGIDAFLNLTTWKRYQDILAVAHIIITPRPGYQLPTTGALWELTKASSQPETSYIHQNLAGGIIQLPTTTLAISASTIRKQIAMKGNPRYLLPNEVYTYIQQHGIYTP